MCVLASHTMAGLSVGRGEMGEGWVITQLLLPILAERAEPNQKASFAGESGSKFSMSKFNEIQHHTPRNANWILQSVLLMSNRTFPGDKPIYRLMEFNVLKYQ